MPLYFAYGSNMDREAMARRCPASKPVGLARLARHRFFVSRDGYASVARNPRGTVWGLLWDLALSDVPALDRYESIATGLYDKVVQSVLTERGPRRAMLYLGRGRIPGQPKPDYMEGVVRAAGEIGLPPDYVRSLAHWLPNPPESSQPAGRPKVRPRWSAPASTIRPSGRQV